MRFSGAQGTTQRRNMPETRRRSLCAEITRVPQDVLAIAYGRRHRCSPSSWPGLVPADGFSIQNVIGGLVLRRAPERPERRSHLALDPLPQDIEIELEPCYGPSGLIRSRAVSIAFEPGKPNAQDS